MSKMAGTPESFAQLMSMPIEDALGWILGGGSGIVAGGLGYRLLFGKNGSGDSKQNSQTREEANETLKGLVGTMSEIRDFLRDFCSGVKADHARQLEVQRAEGEVLQHMTELLVRIDARLGRNGG